METCFECHQNDSGCVVFLSQLEEVELRGVALLVFANKQDLPRAMSASDITAALGLSGVSQPVGVHGTSLLNYRTQ